jgi:hypothetical protein
LSEESPRRDELLVAYVEAVEAVLRAHRGSDQALSPRDFVLVRGWYEAGVPLAAVLVAIDAAFAAEPTLSGLGSLRRRVDELAAPGPRAQAQARESERSSLPELAEALAELKARLLELPPRAASHALAEVDSVADLVAVASRPNWDYLRSHLRRIDELVASAALEALGPEQSDVLRQEAVGAAERHRGRVDAGSLEAAVDRLLRQRAREWFKLPRVGLY